MAQIFVSHSRNDTKPLDFLNKAFASSNVQAKYEEIEAIVQGNRTAPQVAADIAASNALMVVLGPHVEMLKHTRDWVAWESGRSNRDVWVLESLEDSPKLSVVIPLLRHYVCFEYTDPWLAYLRSIVNSYDDSHILKATVAGAGIGGIGAALAETSPGLGALIVGGVALFLAANAQTRPSGLPLCCPQCRSFYNVHVSAMTLRCPVCNSRICLAPPPQTS